jgi:hypothetical protein
VRGLSEAQLLASPRAQTATDRRAAAVFSILTAYARVSSAIFLVCVLVDEQACGGDGAKRTK